MKFFIQYLKNRFRGLARESTLGRSYLQMRHGASQQRICFVSATRRSAEDFWATTPLGKSLAPWLKDGTVKACIRFKNSEGLPAVYNQQLQDAESTDILVFLHDDVWLTDGLLLEKLRSALRRFDVIGLAGNRRRQPLQPAWIFSRQDGSNFECDWPWLSGAVSHGKPGDSDIDQFGPSPMPCQLLDGVFLAAPAALLKASGVRFDERFTFDFYDMDFCRSATRAGLMLGTWPITIIHESAGEFGKPSWVAARQVYFDKWEE